MEGSVAAPTSASCPSGCGTSPSCISEAGPGVLLTWSRMNRFLLLRLGGRCPWPLQAGGGQGPQGPGPGDTRCPEGPPSPG